MKKQISPVCQSQYLSIWHALEQGLEFIFVSILSEGDFPYLHPTSMLIYLYKAEECNLFLKICMGIHALRLSL